MLHYNFPPLGGIASVRASKIASQLPACGWLPVVVAPAAAAFHADRTLDTSSLNVMRTGSVEWVKLKKHRHPLTGKAGDGTSRGRLRSWLRPWLYLPDGQIGWYPFALRAARQAVAKAPAHLVFSSSPPITAHLVARRLHRETGLPWVAEFRDLWTARRMVRAAERGEMGTVVPASTAAATKPPRKRMRFCDLWDPEIQYGRYRHAIDQRIERGLLAEANGVITVSNTYAEYFRAAGVRKISVVTNGFDPSDFVGQPKVIEPVASYLGTYYPGIQDLETPIDALMGSNGANRGAGLRLQVIGDLPREISRLFAGQRSDSFTCTGFVPHDSSVDLLRRSALLVLAGPVSTVAPALKGHIPGKTFEYLASQRPILFVGDRTSDVAELLAPFKRVRVVASRDVEGARTAIASLVGTSVSPGEPELVGLSYSTLAARTAQFFEEVVA